MMVREMDSSIDRFFSEEERRVRSGPFFFEGVVQMRGGWGFVCTRAVGYRMKGSC